MSITDQNTEVQVVHKTATPSMYRRQHLTNTGFYCICFIKFYFSDHVFCVEVKFFLKIKETASLVSNSYRYGQDFLDVQYLVMCLPCSKNRAPLNITL